MYLYASNEIYGTHCPHLNTSGGEAGFSQCATSLKL